MRNDHGLTLIEVCLVVLILGLIISAATAQFSRSYAQYRLKAAARTVARDLRTAYQRAVFQSQPFRFRVWQNGYGYALDSEEGGDALNHTAVRERDWREVLTRALPDGYTLRPFGSIIEFPPSGRIPEGELIVYEKQGRRYRIVLHDGKINVQRDMASQ